LVSRQTRCAVQEGTGLFGHTKTAIGEAGPDIFGSAARQSHFIVVNDGCAVGRVGPDNTVAQEPADDRPSPTLIGWAPDIIRKVRPERCALAIARASARKSRAARTSGNPSRKRRTEEPAPMGVAS